MRKPVSRIAALSLLLASAAGCDPNAKTMPQPMPWSHGSTALNANPATPLRRTPTSSIAPTRNPQGEVRAYISEATDSIVAENLSLGEVFCLAYRTPDQPGKLVPTLSDVRVIAAEPLPAGRFDVHVYTPDGSAAQMRQQLRTALQQQFGLRGRLEYREEECAVLIQADVAPTANAIPPRPEAATRVTLSGTDMNMLCEQLEQRLVMPVVNAARREGTYELVIDFPTAESASPPARPAAIRTALRNQLGLDIVPEMRAVEMVIIER